MQVVWFKRDLRTVDHRPLAEAAASGPLIPLYVAEPAYWALPDASRRQWLATASALDELAQRLAELGAPLIVRIGNAVDHLARIHRAVGITRLLAHQETGNGWTFARDAAVRRFCRNAGVPFVEYPQFGVIRGLSDRDDWSRLHSRFVNAPPAPEPVRLVAGCAARRRPIPAAADLGLVDDGCAAPQSGARHAALGLLDSFFSGRGADYRRAMSNPLGAAAACSRLSVALSTGALSMREALARAAAERARLAALAPAQREIPLAAVDSLTARLHWRCHFMQKLETEPEIEFRALHPAHERARRPHDGAVFAAWAEGRTGFPFADACMRALIAEGWLNFRMRAMLQSFASYQLGLDWRASGEILARRFTDYEPGVHWPQTQMQAGQTGINAPRIYNPVKQGLDQDPDGRFTRRWAAELAGVPAALLQTPWRMDGDTERAAGCRIGVDYPAQIVDLAAAARAARDRLAAARREPGYRAEAEAVFRRHGSRKRRIHDDDPAKRRALRARRASRQLALDL